MLVRTRRIVGIGLAAVLLLTAGAIALGEHRGWPMLRAPLESSLSSSTGVPVRLGGNFHLDLVTGSRIAVQELFVGAADGVDAPHLVSARDVVLDWRWIDLWHWWRGNAPLTVTSLAASALDAHLVRLPDGRASWRLRRAKSEAPAETGADPGLPRVGALALQRGLLQWRDALLDADLRVDVAGGDTAAGGDAAGYRAQVKGRYQDLPLDLQVNSGGVLPLLTATAGASEAPPLKLRVQGMAGAARVSFDGSAAALLEARRLEGNVRISGPSLAQVGEPFGITLPQTPPFELSGRLTHDGASHWTMNGTQARIGSSAFGGDFALDRTRNPPHLKAQVRGSRLALRDLGPAVGVGSPAATPQRALPQRRFDLPALRVMDADASLAFDELDFDSQTLGALRKVSTQLKLEQGILNLAPFTAQVAGGQVSGTSRLDGTQPTARWVAKLDLRHIDIAGWVRGVQKGEAAPPQKSDRVLAQERRRARQQGDAPNSYITGLIDADIDAQGTGISTASILGSLNGKAQLRLRDGTLSHLVTEGAGLDITQALGVVFRGDEALPLRCGLLDVAMTDGRVEIRRGVLDNRDSTILIGGRVSLRDESLEVVARAKPKDTSFATLRSPVTVTGHSMRRASASRRRRWPVA